MSPKRGDRVTVPAPEGHWEIRFGTSEAANGWEELCRLAVANTRRCFDTVWLISASPRHPKDTDR